MGEESFFDIYYLQIYSTVKVSFLLPLAVRGFFFFMLCKAEQWGFFHGVAVRDFFIFFLLGVVFSSFFILDFFGVCSDVFNPPINA